MQLPGISIQTIHIDSSNVVINALIKRKNGICPICGKKSKRVHSTYYRNLQDVAAFSKPVTIRLLIKKYRCTNSKCERKIFSQQLPSVINRYSRRTHRANEQITRISLEMSAQKSSLLSKHIGLPVSSSTCLRLASRCDIPLDNQVKHIGVDDWAYKKRHTYGTILVDRESGKVIDLIKSRDKEDVIAWLKKQPSIDSVTRDRAECYSQSIRIALPEVFQIADRFHLVVNYSDYVNRVVQKLIPELKKVKYQNNRSQPTIRDPGIQQIVNLAYDGAGVLKETKKDLILKVKEFHKRGYPKNRIARMLGLNFRTVYKYIHNDLSQIDTLSNPRVNYSEYLEDLIAGYCQGEKLRVIYRSIKQK